MKTTPLTEVHKSLGAKMTAYAGYEMPVVYSSISEEHETVRNKVGVFDVSHMGEFIVKGKEAIPFLQSVTSNDVNKLEIGEAQYSCLPNDKGGIVDDLIIYRLDEDKCSEGENAFMLVVNAANLEKDWQWLNDRNNYDVKLTDISDKSGLLAVQGLKAEKTIQKLVDEDISGLSFYMFKKTKVGGIDNVLLSVTGYTGSGGYELYVDNKDLKTLWEKVMEAGEEFDILPCGLGARDTLRLEMGYCLYGNDINETTSPLEAGLGWITKLNKKEDFSSKELFKAQKEAGVERKLVGFVMKDRRVPRHGYEIYNTDEERIGEVTSGTQSPSLDIPIGMGYVEKAYAKVGTEIKVKFGKKMLSGEVVKLPFYRIKE